MKKNKKKLILVVIAVIILIAGVIFSIINIMIASNVISSMADIRIEKNEAKLSDYGLIGEQIQVSSFDGVKISAYVVSNSESKGNVIILHGMHGMDATSLFDYAKFIHDNGYTPIVVDMRAHGKSGGTSLSFGYHETNDVISIVRYLKQDERFKNVPFILYGLSMGGSTAINVASKSKDIDAVIAVSPFLSIQDQVADYMRRDGAPSLFVKIFKPYVNFVLRSKYDVDPVKESPKNSIKNITDIPLFIIHGDIDKQTNVYHAYELYKRSQSQKKQIWIVEGKDHLIIDNILDEESKYYQERVVEFLNTIK